MSGQEAIKLFIILLISLMIMVVAELYVFNRHLRPIRNLFEQNKPSLKMLESVYLHAHRFPILALKRIFGPHLFGLSIPASIMLIFSVQQGWISLPYSYLLLAAIGVPLVACMHAFIEFFLTAQSIRPLSMYIRQLTIDSYGIDLSLNGKVLVSVQRKFQFSAFLIGTFPLFLFILSGYIRQDVLANQNTVAYWNWATIILFVGIAFSSLGAWVLSREVQHPIHELRTNRQLRRPYSRHLF